MQARPNRAPGARDGGGAEAQLSTHRVQRQENTTRAPKDVHRRRQPGRPSVTCWRPSAASGGPRPEVVTLTRPVLGDLSEALGGLLRSPAGAPATCVPASVRGGGGVGAQESGGVGGRTEGGGGNGQSGDGEERGGGAETEVRHRFVATRGSWR